MTWIMHERDQLRTIAEIESQTPRAAAIVATAFMDNRLKEAIQLRLIDDGDLSAKLLNGSGPIAALSTRIDLGCALGLYPPELALLMHKLRELRNDFAHWDVPAEWETTSINQRCRNLIPLINAANQSCSAFSLQIYRRYGYPEQRRWHGIFTFDGFAERHDMARYLFMSSVKIALMWLTNAMDVLEPHRPSRSIWLEKPQ